MRRSLGLLILLLFMVGSANAQLSLTAVNTPATIDFTGYTGAGFTTPAGAGQLDSNMWAITGWSNGNLTFGGTQVTANTDYTRGTVSASQTTGGLYAYNNSGNIIFYMQIGSGDFEPGAMTLKVQNNSGTTMNKFVVAYDLYNRNDQARSNTFNLSTSTDDATYTAYSAADFASPAASDALNLVLVGGSSPSRTATITGVSVPNGGFFYVRWSSAANGGSGSRDEFGLDNISVTGQVQTSDYTVNPASVGITGVDIADLATSRTKSVTVNATNATTITAITPAGSTAWAYSGSVPVVIGAASAATLNFVYTPDVNDGSTDLTTFTLTTTGTPASSTVVATGRTVLETTLAAFKTAAQTGATAGNVFKFPGTVSANTISTASYQLSIQDRTDGDAATRGVTIFDPSFIGKGASAIPAVGDGITVYGTYTNFRGLIELAPTRAYTRDTTGATLTPLTVSAANLTTTSVTGDNYEAVLITVRASDLPIGGLAIAAGTKPLNASFYATDQPGNKVQVFLNTTTKISFTAVDAPAAYYDITGVGAQFDSTNPIVGGSGFQITPRQTSDFAFNAVPVELSTFTAE
jgi:hypothetical protein